MNVVVYSKANCPACVRVKSELTLKAVAFTEIRVDQQPEMRDWLLSQGHRSVPQVYVNGVHTDPLTISNEINE
jgi:glutaredoxin 3